MPWNATEPHYSRDHSGYGIDQWETLLQCNGICHWLSAYPEWSLLQEQLLLSIQLQSYASGQINSLAPGRCGCGSNSKSMIFKLINHTSSWGLIEIALRWIPQNLTDQKLTLVPIMAWCHQATSHYMGQCWPRSMLSYCITWQQWVNFNKVISGNINMDLDFIWFLHNEIQKTVEIIPHGRQRDTYHTEWILGLQMTWQHKDPGHWQPWYWLCSPRTFQPQHYRIITRIEAPDNSQIHFTNGFTLIIHTWQEQHLAII